MIKEADKIVKVEYVGTVSTVIPGYGEVIPGAELELTEKEWAVLQNTGLFKISKGKE